MYLHGYYYNQHGEKIAVHILTGGDRSDDIEIGSKEGSDIFFTDDPVELSSQVNDTFDHLLLSQASVRLNCRNYVPGFFCNSCREAVVNIYRDDRCLFAGYIEPQAFSQPYNEEYDEVELTCIDALSALQYSNYHDIGSLGVSYDAVKGKAQQRTFLDIAREIIGGATADLDIVGDMSSLPLYYDGSKAVDATEAHHYTILADISVSELLFLGDEEDDTWTQEDVLTEMLKYLNLHIVQDGLRFYLFSWETIRGGGELSFRDIMGEESQDLAIHPKLVEVKTEHVSDCDTQISIAATYNQLLLTASTKETENVVESPLDGDTVQNAFEGKQKYMTELLAKGTGKSARNGFGDIVGKGSTTYDAASITDWYVQVRKNPLWKFYRPGKKDVVEEFCQGENQQDLLAQTGKEMGMAALLSLGKVSRNRIGNDNSPVSRISMTDYLCISVNGNFSDDESRTHPSAEEIKAAIPCAEYIGNNSGGNFSPADERVTNYIVVSGNVVMNPYMLTSGAYAALRRNFDPAYALERKDGWAFYTVQHWKARHWNEEVTWDSAADESPYYGFQPFTGEGKQLYQFHYSAVGESDDKLSKVAVIACMLVIGDKCVVEKQPGQYLGTDGIAGTGNGQLSDYVWMPYKERSECASDDEYYQQSFTVGFDPKIDDFLLGTEYKIQNNLDYTMNVDAEGTAIPIRKADRVHGKVRFSILGPVNNLWNDITRRHPSFWRGEKWTQNTVSLLAHTKNILLKELEVKVYSDNGKAGETSDDSDIVYMSDTKEKFVNRKDDIEMKLSTALTMEECADMGVTNSVCLSSPIRSDTGDSLLSITRRADGETAKPEQLYVDDYWREWHEPRVEMTQDLMDEGDTVSLFNLYRNPAIGKTFHVEGIGRNLTEGTAEMQLKEVF